MLLGLGRATPVRQYAAESEHGDKNKQEHARCRSAWTRSHFRLPPTDAISSASPAQAAGAQDARL